MSNQKDDPVEKIVNIIQILIVSLGIADTINMEMVVGNIKKNITEIINNMEQVYGVCKELTNTDNIDRFKNNIKQLKNKIIPDDIDKTNIPAISIFLKAKIKGIGSLTKQIIKNKYTATNIIIITTKNQEMDTKKYQIQKEKDNNKIQQLQEEYRQIQEM